MVVVLAHDADLFGLLDAFPWLLDRGCLLLGRSSSLLVLCGTMATHELHLGLDFAKDLIHASHSVDCCVHSTIGSILIQVISLWLLGRSARCCGGCWVLLNLALSHRIMTRFSVAR